MGKIIKLTEDELHRIIKQKIQEALEHNVDLDYSPAIGNKKRGPGKETMDQMKKRRNTKLDEDIDERDIMRRYPDGYEDYDGDDCVGGPENGSFYLELGEDAYSYAFQEIYGRVPGNLSDLIEEYELPEEVDVRFSLDITVSPGDYDTPSNSDAEVSDWEIKDTYVDSLSPEMGQIVQKAAEYAMESVDANELTGYVNESKTVQLTMEGLHKLIAESVKKIVSEAFFGSKIVSTDDALKQWTGIAQKFGYGRVVIRKGMINFYMKDRNGEDAECKTNIPLPKKAMSGMFGTGTSGYDPKSYQQVTQQLSNFFSQRKKIHDETNTEKSQWNKEWGDYQEKQRRSPEAIQAQREKRWERDAEIEKGWRDARRGYYPTGEINDYRG